MGNAAGRAQRPAEAHVLGRVVRDYKVPSLKGVWYRSRYLHDGAAATLEELFDPDRPLDTHVRGGWRPLGEKTRAIGGHDFGLELTAEEGGQLIAFLRTL